MNYVSMTFAAGIEIEDAVNTAIARSMQLGYPVRFEFNLQDIAVTGDSVPSDVINEYMRRNSGGRDDGGPCHPAATYENREGTLEAVAYSQGATMWDYFFAEALKYCRGGDFEKLEHLASDCANIADAMIAERKKRGIGK